jgi:acetyltransferase-like isoleucine patch superfamily enzyme
MILVYMLWQLLAKIKERYRAQYYAALHPGQVRLHQAVVFSKNTALTIAANNRLAKVTIGSQTVFRKNCTINMEGQGKLTIGKGSFFNNGCSISCLGTIAIGDDTLFGEGVRLYDHNHVFNQAGKLVKTQGYAVGKIKIGNNCWIGSNCVILKDVEIGDNVVIGASCLISTSVPANTVVRSVPQLVATPLVLHSPEAN